MIVRAALIVPLLSGCAVDCTNPDWRSRGYRDGYGGHPPQDMVLERQCGRITVSQTAYLEGWRAGHDEHERLKTMKDD